MEFQCFEVKPEDITECPRDDKPSTGMFAISDDTDPLSLICHSLFFKVRGLMNQADQGRQSFYRVVTCVQCTVAVSVQCTDV